MKKLVGMYSLGFRNIRLYVDLDSEDGSVILTPKNMGTTEIYVGIDIPFYESLGVLLHEVYELILIDLNTRYKAQPSFSYESSDFTFIISHNQLSEAHERAGMFLSTVYKDFEKAYEKCSRYNSLKGKK